MLKRVYGNLWVWVIAAFLLVIAAWFWTVRVARNSDDQSIPEGETLERQPPAPIATPNI